MSFSFLIGTVSEMVELRQIGDNINHTSICIACLWLIKRFAKTD